MEGDVGIFGTFEYERGSKFSWRDFGTLKSFETRFFSKDFIVKFIDWQLEKLGFEEKWYFRSDKNPWNLMTSLRNMLLSEESTSLNKAYGVRVALENNKITVYSSKKSLITPLLGNSYMFEGKITDCSEGAEISGLYRPNKWRMATLVFVLCFVEFYLSVLVTGFLLLIFVAVITGNVTILSDALSIDSEITILFLASFFSAALFYGVIRLFVVFEKIGRKDIYRFLTSLTSA